MLARVRRTLAQRRLLEGGGAVLVACSGGPDSAALLHVLHRLADELGITLHAASVHHGLRPDADVDLAAAGRLAERLAVPFTALRVIVGPGASVQAEARRARYEALLLHASKLGAARVAVGHTLDDQAETVLARLLRGAGLSGLSGIEPARADGVVRPLLDCRRAQVRAHVARFDLPHVTDPSNADPRYERVRLREVLLPALAQEDPRVAEHLSHLADEARQVSRWMDGEATRLLDARTSPTELWLADNPPVDQRAIRRWILELTGQPAKRAHLEGLAGAGPVLLPRGWQVVRSEQRLIARRASTTTRSDRRRRPASQKIPKVAKKTKE